MIVKENRNRRLEGRQCLHCFAAFPPRKRGKCVVLDIYTLVKGEGSVQLFRRVKNLRRLLLLCKNVAFGGRLWSCRAAKAARIPPESAVFSV